MRFFFAVLFLLSFYAYAEFIGKVVGVSDGDTVTVLDAETCPSDVGRLPRKHEV